MKRFAAIARELERVSAVHCASTPERRVTGGSISETYAWGCATGRWFVKLGPRAGETAFAAEAEGLATLAHAGALRVPRVIARGTTAAAAFLALEWIDPAPADAGAQARLGAGLAALHAVSSVRFGFERDNLIGATPQLNGWSANWAQFFCERRLGPQLVLAAHHGFGPLLGEAGHRLLDAVPTLLAGHHPAASLLHGDLWHGNWLASTGGEAVIFDPAVYYGDREADVAMTRLFGGFGPAFYAAYEAAAPLAPGWQARAELYNLYHVLNHANLFGGGYPIQALTMMERLLA
jgi:protein-ribulosamine 3-kinase